MQSFSQQITLAEALDLSAGREQLIDSDPAVHRSVSVAQRLFIAVAFFITLGITLHCEAAESHATQPEWKVGYWLWNGHGTPPASEAKVDLLYVQAGTFGSYSSILVGGDLSALSSENLPPVRLAEVVQWPTRLPQAEAYFAVWRNKSPVSPGTDLVPKLVQQYQDLKRRAARAGQRLIGLQIDHDSPTNLLDEYARFLKALREALPKEDLVSITALLDWFRPDTRVGETLQWVNEYIPQFYDVDADRRAETPLHIAKTIDVSQWAPIFNAHRRPYRIGISSFGRVAIVKSQAPTERMYFRDLSPLEVTAKKGFAFITEQRNEAGEPVVRYKVTRAAENENYDTFAPGDIIEMVLPPQESAQEAYMAAKALGGLCAGVVFFRWPTENEAFVLHPDEIQDIIAGKNLTARRTVVEAEDGECAAVGCADLYLRLGNRFPRKPLTLWINTSSELEYILPAEHMKVRIQGPRTLEVRLPPYAGVPRIYLGRVVTRDQARFTVKTQQ